MFSLVTGLLKIIGDVEAALRRAAGAKVLITGLRRAVSFDWNGNESLVVLERMSGVNPAWSSLKALHTL